MKKNFFLTILTLSLTATTQAATMGCSGRNSSVLIDDSSHEVTISGQNALALTELLLGSKNAFVDKVLLSMDQSKIEHKNYLAISGIKATLLPGSKAILVWMNGQKKAVELEGGFLSASFNPVYEIGFSGSLVVLKDRSYSRIDLRIPAEECFDFP